MKLRSQSFSDRRNGFRSGRQFSCHQGVSKLKLSGEEFMSELLNRRWALRYPDTQIQQVMKRKGPQGSMFLLNKTLHGVDGGELLFHIVRDDLLHPLVNGNKARKMDALLPLVQDYSVTDLVTCGGCQSAHAAAIAVMGAERGVKSHLLLRGEQPEILTGYNLLSTIYGNVTYVTRTNYSKRFEMLRNHANLIAGKSGCVLSLNEVLRASVETTSHVQDLIQVNVNRTMEDCPRKVLIVNEGAGDAVALLGVIRLVKYLSQDHLFGKEKTLKFVVDAGTGTTAIGLGLGAIYLQLPWKVNAVMLADTIDGYRQKEECLIAEFRKHFSFHLGDSCDKVNRGVVNWVERHHTRKFGNVMDGELEMCQQIARQTGILLDPIYTLAAWEEARSLREKESNGVSEVVMLHTGGTLGMFGLAQRYKTYFRQL